MNSDFDLVVDANNDALRAELRLLDASGAQVGYREVQIGEIAPATLQGLFNLREFVGVYAAKQWKGWLGPGAIVLQPFVGGSGRRCSGTSLRVYCANGRDVVAANADHSYAHLRAVGSPGTVCKLTTFWPARAPSAMQQVQHVGFQVC
jgi:hypothetical protein